MLGRLTTRCARFTRGCPRLSTAAPKPVPPPPPPKPAPPPPPPRAASSNPAVAFARWYDAVLEARPVQTKMVTSGVLFALGDMLGQYITHVREPAPKEGEAGGWFDWGRLARATAYGGIFYPPVAHVHFEFLEWIVVSRLAVSASMMPWAKMFLEQFVYWGWLSNAYYHSVLGFLQGMNATQIYERVSSTLMQTMIAQWIFWVPVQVINFKYTPLRYQLNVVLVVSLVWTTFLSLAFPPPKLGDDDKTKKA